MAKEKAVVTTGVDGREVYESPSFSINYTQMVGSSTGSLGPIPKINTKKLKIQFDPNFKKASIYEQTLDPNGSTFINLGYEHVVSEANIINYDYEADSFSLSFSKSLKLN